MPDAEDQKHYRIFDFWFAQKMYLWKLFQLLLTKHKTITLSDVNP